MCLQNRKQGSSGSVDLEATQKTIPGIYAHQILFIRRGVQPALDQARRSGQIVGFNVTGMVGDNLTPEVYAV